MKLVFYIKIIALSAFLLSCQTRKVSQRSPGDAANEEANMDSQSQDPKIQMAQTQNDEAIVRQYFDFIPPNEEAYCPPNSFANGISQKSDTLFCLSGTMFEQKESQTFYTSAENTLICPIQTAAIAIKTNQFGKPIQIRCHKTPASAGIDQEDTITNTADSDSAYYCDGGSFLKGVQLSDKGVVSGVICGTRTDSHLNGLHLSDIKPSSSGDLIEVLDKAKKVEIRSKYLSLSGDYYVFVDGRQVAIADGTLFSFGYEYNLTDLKKTFHFRIKENIFSLLSNYKISKLDRKNPKKLQKINDNDLIPVSYFQVPLELAWGLYFKWYNHSESLLGSIDQRNLTFLQVYDIRDNKDKKTYYIEQKFHLLRQVFTIEKLNDSTISMPEMVLATVILDRHLARQRDRNDERSNSYNRRQR